MSDAPVEEVAAGIHAVRLPMPVPRIPSVLVYLIEDAAGDVHLVDTGLSTPESEAALERALSGLGRRLEDVRSVTATHYHPDHLGQARRLRDAGARIALHRDEAAGLAGLLTVSDAELDAWGVPPERHAEVQSPPPPDRYAVDVDRWLQDGDRLDLPGRDLRVLHLPGHTPGSIGIVGDGLVLTGDTLLPDQFAGIGLGLFAPGANPIREYLDSLERLREHDGLLGLPGHGWVWRGLAERIDATAAHHGRRTDEVAHALAADPAASIWDIASRLTWSSGWGALRGFYTASALRQTQWHAELVRAR